MNQHRKDNLSAGLLMCSVKNNGLRYFLVHPGGPYFRNKEKGAWTIPKGLPDDGEALLDTARREFFEETGIKPMPPFHDIGSIRQKGGKVVKAWAFEGKWDAESGIRCNYFQLEWPPHSGKWVDFPEVDRACWMVYAEAIDLINLAQIPLLERARTFFSRNDSQ